MKERIIALAAIIVCFGICLGIWKLRGGKSEFKVGPPCSPGKVTPQLRSAMGVGLMLAPDGSLWGWGGGHGPTSSLFGKEIFTEEPVCISKDTDWQRIAVSPSGGMALKRDGSLWVWGANASLATGSTNLAMVPTRAGTAVDWVDISASAGHCMALKGDGTLWAWGQNEKGQAGVGNRKTLLSLRQIGSDADWSSVTAGSFNSFALKRDGTIWGWGLSLAGSNGPGDYLVPTQLDSSTNWSKLTAGNFHLAALRQDGTLWILGQNCKLVTANAAGPSATFMQVNTDRDWCDIYSGSNYLIAQKKDGSWWASGVNDHGQLGLGSMQNGGLGLLKKIPFDFEPWAMACGAQTTLLLTRDGKLWTWGHRMGSKPWPQSFQKGREIINEIFRSFLSRPLFRPALYQIDLAPYQLGVFAGDQSQAHE